ncbi:hypothetical protein WA026_005630 [Henosepilachna vigintioctopunctata]|uniref:Uncharacterized protein n=1 Tax=Henosepilachna vigintioctopunctata TaxID=420089 RepID=A0AAW1U2H2_9CUCU
MKTELSVTNGYRYPKTTSLLSYSFMPHQLNNRGFSRGSGNNTTHLKRSPECRGGFREDLDSDVIVDFCLTNWEIILGFLFQERFPRKAHEYYLTRL